MANKDLTTRKWGGLRSLRNDRPFDIFRGEIESLHRAMDRMFEDVWSGGFKPSLLSDVWSTRELVPSLDVTEDDKAFRVTVELPGMDQKDVEVSVADRLLTIRGEKKEDQEKKDKDVYRRERAYGEFRRVLELPADVEAEKIDASFRNGILTIELPKTKEALQKVKQIPVKAA
jgi:HSP20 family protein